MNPLNDDELNALLRQAKANPPKPGRTLPARTMLAYRERFARPPFWRRRLLVPVLAAFLLILVGTLGSLGPSTDVGEPGPIMPQRAEPKAADLTLKDFQPVQALEPRVVKSMRDDQEHER